jgi:methyl-accepting chemotaxis protein
MNSARQESVRSFRRRNYLINPGFQWKQAGAITLIVFFISATTSAVLYSVLHQQARQLATNPTGYRPDTALIMVCFGLGFAALTAGGVGLWSILMTHRICGPLFVMKRYLTQIADGRLPVLRPLRRRDEFKDLYEALDEAIQSLRAKKRSELSQVNAALEAANRALNAEGETTHEGLESIVSRLEWLKSRADEALAEVNERREEAPVVAGMPARHGQGEHSEMLEVGADK